MFAECSLMPKYIRCEPFDVTVQKLVNMPWKYGSLRQGIVFILKCVGSVISHYKRNIKLTSQVNIAKYS